MVSFYIYCRLTFLLSLIYVPVYSINLPASYRCVFFSFLDIITRMVNFPIQTMMI